MTILAAIGEERASNPVIETGYDLAETYDETLVVLHVIPEKEFQQHKEDITGGQSVFDDYGFAQEEEHAAEFAERVVEETVEEVDSDRISGVGRVGDPEEHILAVADEVDPRYLVIGGRRRSPTGKAIFGDITQSVLLQAEVPVVTIMMED